MILREATSKDLAACVEIGKEFWNSTPYGDTLEYSPSGVLGLLSGLIQARLMIVAIYEDEIVGVAALIVTPCHFNPEILTGVELFWYVRPSVRDSGVGELLLEVMEDMAIQKGVTIWSMGTIGDEQAEKMLLKRGYLLTEKTFTKVL